MLDLVFSVIRQSLCELDLLVTGNVCRTKANT